MSKSTTTKSLLATFGVARVKVYRRLRVALLSSAPANSVAA